MSKINSLSEFKEAITGNENKAADLLVEISREFSTDDDIKSKAVSLKTDYAISPDDPEIRKGLLAEIIDLASEIFQNSHLPKVEEDVKVIQERWLEKIKPEVIIFECKEVSKQYRGTKFRLTDINLVLKSGEITGVVGENGNGKTTLLKIIAGILNPDSGTISYGSLQANSDYIDWRYIKRQIAYVPQELGRLLGSVKQALQFSASLHGIRGQQNDREVERVIQRLGLGNFKSATWQELSGGYKFRFALARILVWKPRLIVLDEPLANLDINTQIRVLNDLKDLCKSIKNPIAVILSSQNIEEVEAVSDNMIVLKAGEIKYYGKTINIGDNRKMNIYEFKCINSYEDLTEKFKNLSYINLDHNGFSYFITTPLNVSEINFLEHCTKEKIFLQLFQNISSSTKKIIVQTNIG